MTTGFNLEERCRPFFFSPRFWGSEGSASTSTCHLKSLGGGILKHNYGMDMSPKLCTRSDPF